MYPQITVRKLENTIKELSKYLTNLFFASPWYTLSIIRGYINYDIIPEMHPNTFNIPANYGIA